jgi:hypothetical protein
MICITSLSCIKEKLEVTYNNQESKIDKFIESNMYQTTTDEDGSTRTDTLRVLNLGGSNRLVLEEGIGEELNDNGTIAFYYAGYIFSGSISNTNLFITNHAETATQAGWSLTEEEAKVLTINMKEYELVPGLRSGLIGVRSGEECQILFTGKYGFGNKAFGTIPANSPLVYRIWVESISND